MQALRAARYPARPPTRKKWSVSNLVPFPIDSPAAKKSRESRKSEDSLEGTPGAPTPTTSAAGAPVRTAAPPAKGGCCAIA